MMSPFTTALALAAVGLRSCHAIELDVSDSASIMNASTTVAYGLMSLYTYNQTGTPTTDVGTFPSPVYWWEAGAAWGGMIDYWAYTNDSSYVPTVQQALLAQEGPDDNFMPPAYFGQLGNDDQAFWTFAALSAAEYGFPVPEGNSSTAWLDLAEAAWNTMWPRWNTSVCGGGLRWQIFSSNSGYDYKNTISNGGFFQISARLWRYTGNETYLNWAETAYNWIETIGLIDSDYNVYDGTSTTVNCSQIDHALYSYNPAVLLYGTAIMYNQTGDEVWANRSQGILTAMEGTYFSPYPNATDIMFQPSCEPTDSCDTDQFSFKGYNSRWMAQAAVFQPDLTDSVTKYLAASAQAAAQACSGGTNGETCGAKWYIGGFDGSTGPGQELSVLETLTSLLLLDGSAARIVPGKAS